MTKQINFEDQESNFDELYYLSKDDSSEKSQYFDYINNEPSNPFCLESYNNLDFQRQITDDIFNSNKNDHIKDIKPKESNINFKSNLRTDFDSQKVLIFNITKEKKKIKFGRRRKHNMGGKHNKFSKDNIARKIKSKLFECILYLLNDSIRKEINENKQNKLICSKYLFKLDQKVIKDINTNKMKKLLKTKLKDIFYLNKVSSKYINYGLDYNKKIIQNIYKYKTQQKTISILEKTFYECLEHFRGSKYYEELDGIEKDYINTIDEFRENGESEKYIDDFKYLVNTFETFFEEKMPKKSKKKLYYD